MSDDRGPGPKVHPEWPDPLGYVTTDEPEWVGPQAEWKSWVENPSFFGRVQGSIPDAGDCDRHPDLPPDAYALKTVSLTPPGKEAKYHFPKRKFPFDRPGGSWSVCITYKRVRKHGYPTVELFSTEAGAEPIEQTWKVIKKHDRDERRHVEFFDGLGAAAVFVLRQTGLDVPEPP